MKVLKYRIDLDYTDTVRVPGQVLSVGLDPHSNVCVWSLVPDGATGKPQEVFCLLTGAPADAALGARFIGTVRDGGLMVHVFARALP